ncbi:putative dehydrogenase [Paenibacillus shirakamiensis]|uniref:Dehydrogenase n=1 Tax=Paenibacillus shirakamiensis TaxID=1265935 RepID=A0ABS4JE13_9BACL|nr:Gfo/Idh/MocA family oxidoreductase [Paenibacillus shirakamiensis]MBP1999933.1 putative dehydrogenase [Paenibacillus shirakamiensis]
MIPLNNQRVGICGIGHRALSTYLPFFKSEVATSKGYELVAVADTNPDQLTKAHLDMSDLLLFESFEEMLSVVPLDYVILASPDHVHYEHILLALAKVKHVICEKPMVIHSAQAHQVLLELNHSPSSLIVTHNLRYLSLNSTIKSLLNQRKIGQVTVVQFSYHLLPGHGASYYRRWHRYMQNSGGFAVTKSCHHFDLINWWIEDRPAAVSGYSHRNYYMPDLYVEGKPSTTIPKDAELDDTWVASIQYTKGALAMYVLHTYSTFEGFHLMISGTKGNLEVKYDKNSTSNYQITFNYLDGRREMIEVQRESGRHSGADQQMLEHLFNMNADDRRCSALDAAYAVAIGDAINRSSSQGTIVQIRDVFPSLV